MPIPLTWFRKVHVGDLVSVLRRTGIRWGAARAMLVRDFAEVPVPALQLLNDAATRALSEPA